MSSGVDAVKVVDYTLTCSFREFRKILHKAFETRVEKFGRNYTFSLQAWSTTM